MTNLFSFSSQGFVPTQKEGRKGRQGQRGDEGSSGEEEYYPKRGKGKVNGTA